MQVGGLCGCEAHTPTSLSKDDSRWRRRSAGWSCEFWSCVGRCEMSALVKGFLSQCAHVHCTGWRLKALNWASSSERSWGWFVRMAISSSELCRTLTICSWEWVSRWCKCGTSIETEESEDMLNTLTGEPADSFEGDSLKVDLKGGSSVSTMRSDSTSER